MVIRTKKTRHIPPIPLHPHELWGGAFGDDYTERNRPKWEDRVPFWRRILETTNAQSVLEIGCNAGWNLRAIRSLNEKAMMSGVDLNDKALHEAQEAGFDVERVAGHDVDKAFGHGACELAFTSGVLIHVHPDELKQTMIAIRDVSSQYVLAVEYDSPEEREIEYRGNKQALWARPFGALYEALGLSLVQYGEHADGFDSCAWWLLSKD